MNVMVLIDHIALQEDYSNILNNYYSHESIM